MKKPRSRIFILFFSMLKIGLFTFGGGYAMIALLQREFVEKKKWIEEKEFFDLVAIAESTPGPLAVNSATYIGYQIGKFWGAFLATLAVCIPSFVIIFAISLFFDQFLALEIVTKAFKGIQICVTFLILSAGFKMIKSLEKTPFNYILLAVTILSMVACSLFAVGFSSIYYILISGLIGLFCYLLSTIKNRRKDK